MGNSLAIQPIDLYRLASIRQVALQSLLSATSTNSLSPLDNTSSIVQMSALGQVLGAGAALQSSLEALANATPGTVQTTAQAFVTAFNYAQQSIATALPLVWTLPDNVLVTQLAQTLNASGASSTTTGKQDLSDLQAIGISFFSSASIRSIETTAYLSIDQSVLIAAAEEDTAATATLLSDATQSLLQQVTAFEVQATRSSSLPTDTAVLGPGVPTELLQNLPADTVLNNIQLENLDLAAVGLDINTIRSESSVLDTSLAATATLANTIITTDPTAVADVTPVAVSVTPVAVDTLATPDVAMTETPAVMATTSTTVNQSLPPGPAVPTVDTLSADQAAADATHALQVIMADLALRDVFSNPAYSALIASSHMSDFAMPMMRTRTGSIPAEIPGPILPINRIGATSSYQDAASAFVGR